MPMSYQPVIRFHQEAAESNGILQTLDSVGVTRILYAEGGGATRTKQVPKQFVILRGTVYTAS